MFKSLFIYYLDDVFGKFVFDYKMFIAINDILGFELFLTWFPFSYNSIAIF